MKRKIVRGLLAGLLAVSLWGCGKDKTDEAAQQESVTVAEEEESEADVADDSGAEGETVIQAVTYFIDDAILVGMSRVRILHGTGTGILRTLIRQYLQTVPGISHFADEHIQFGGAGITVVDLS